MKILGLRVTGSRIVLPLTIIPGNVSIINIKKLWIDWKGADSTGPKLLRYSDFPKHNAVGW